MPLRRVLLVVFALLASALTPIAFSSAQAPTSGTVSVRVAKSADDAEELSNGWLDVASSDLELAVEKDSQTVGIRFGEVTIPQGATITGARVVFTVDETGDGPVALTIQAEQAPNPPDFVGNGNVTGRVRTAASVAWTPQPWTTVGAAGAAQTTPDISAVVSEVTSRGDWVSGNAIVLIIAGTGTRTAESYDGSPTQAPLLQVEWTTGGTTTTTTVAPSTTTTIPATTTSTTVPGTTTTTVASTTTTTTIPATTTTTTTVPSTTTTTTAPPSGSVFEVRVAAARDDVEEFPNGYVYWDSSDLELVQENATQIVGVRFTGIPIPRNATITKAWIQFTVDETTNAPAVLSIAADQAGNPGDFRGDRGVSARPIGVKVAWVPEPWPVPGTADADQRTPDLAAVVQQLVARSDWSPGNAMAFVVRGTGTRTAMAFDGGPAQAPLLHVEWTTDSPPSTPTNQPPTLLATATSTTAGGTSSLNASITDDGLPNPPGATTVIWTQVGGPVAVTIANPSAASTTAVLPVSGEYRFRARVTDGALATVQVAVATAAAAPTSSTRIAFIGDYGDGSTREGQVAQMITARGVDAVATAGDNVYTSAGYDRLVGRYYRSFIGNYSGSYGAGSATNRFFPSLGNHDYTDVGLAQYLAYFTLPGAGVPSLGTSGNERYYDARVGDVHLFILNSNPQEPDGLTPTTTQGDWLRNALAASNAEWKLVVFHNTPYSSLPGKAAYWMRWPFEDWGADMVIAGDAHVYERFVIGGFPYLISGLGINNTPLDGPRAPGSAIFYSQNDGGALFITACAGTLQLEYRTLNQGVIDTYKIGTGVCP